MEINDREFVAIIVALMLVQFLVRFRENKKLKNSKNLIMQEESKTLESLILECQNRNYHCSISWQRINDYSIDIYTGYKTNYTQLFYSDGHVDFQEVLKKAFDFLQKDELKTSH